MSRLHLYIASLLIAVGLTLGSTGIVQAHNEPSCPSNPVGACSPKPPVIRLQSLRVAQTAKGESIQWTFLVYDPDGAIADITINGRQPLFQNGINVGATTATFVARVSVTDIGGHTTKRTYRLVNK